MKLTVLVHPWRNLGYSLGSSTHIVVGEARHLIAKEELPLSNSLWSPSHFSSKQEAQDYADKLELADEETPHSIKRFFGAKY